MPTAEGELRDRRCGRQRAARKCSTRMRPEAGPAAAAGASDRGCCALRRPQCASHATWRRPPRQRPAAEWGENATRSRPTPPSAARRRTAGGASAAARPSRPRAACGARGAAGRRGIHEPASVRVAEARRTDAKVASSCSSTTDAEGTALQVARVSWQRCRTTLAGQRATRAAPPIKTLS